LICNRYRQKFVFDPVRIKTITGIGPFCRI